MPFKLQTQRDSNSDQYSLDHSVFFQAYLVATTFAQSMLADLRPAGLNLARWRVLSILRSRESAMIGEIAEITGYRQPIVSQTVREMESKGWVKRQKSDSDQRIVNVSLTNSGHDLFSTLFPLIQARRERALERLSAKEQKQLLEALKVVQQSLGFGSKA